ncbi:MAG: PIN domain-containing protein [Terriglobales bacterium]
MRSKVTPASLCRPSMWARSFIQSGRGTGRRSATSATALVGSPVDLIPVDFSETVKAAELKAKYRCGYADAFAAALAFTKRATLVTIFH